MKSDKKVTMSVAVVAALLSFVVGTYIAATLDTSSKVGVNAAQAAVVQADNPQQESSARALAAPSLDSVELSATQAALVKVETAAERDFPIEKTAVGSIDFNEEMSLQVFTPYQGRIAGLFARVGDEVKKGQMLFTIDSPDLVQASSTLISAAGVLQLTTRNLERLKSLYETRAISQKDLEQAISDQQAAEAALRAARDAIRLFGKTDADIDRIVEERHVDPILVVSSPISGRITARNAAPGLFVQPGNAPAPYSVADISTMWMLANVDENDSPAFRVGQEVSVAVMAFPGRRFQGRISTIGAMVDPTTRRVLVRSEIEDPQHELRSGMFANFVIRTGDPARSPAVPLNGVVREGDGSMTVWVAGDRRRFVKRSVKVGLQHDGYVQIVEGLKVGEPIATDGALFLSNALSTAAR